MVTCDKYHAVLLVSDVTDAVNFYTQKLGFSPGFALGNPPNIAGVNLGDVQIFLEHGVPEPKGCHLYFVVDDADELYEFHQRHDIEIVRSLQDQDYHLRDYVVRDLHGYYLTFGHHIFSDGSSIEIDRVDVHIRLEKRLASLLTDLAARKRMNVSSCVEEILLHTCEPLGDGVASPHTKGQLSHIQVLKQKHGIDYDVHASHRFVEK